MPTATTTDLGIGLNGKIGFLLLIVFFLMLFF
jgi:hypothetical protein